MLLLQLLTKGGSGRGSKVYHRVAGGERGTFGRVEVVRVVLMSWLNPRNWIWSSKSSSSPTTTTKQGAGPRAGSGFSINSFTNAPKLRARSGAGGPRILAVVLGIAGGFYIWQPVFRNYAAESTPGSGEGAAGPDQK